MSCCGGGGGEDAAKSSQIDKVLNKSRKVIINETKLLLLGPGESGKSTIVKQLRIINNKWLSDEERNSYKSIVRSNAITSMGALVKALQKSNHFEDLTEEEQEFGESLSSPTVMSLNEISQEMMLAIKTLWASEIVKNRFKNKSDVQIIDSAAFFFDNVERISKQDYVPTDEDILLSRVRTTGITEFCFDLAGMPMRLVDVGGQRAERRKWIHCFEEVNAIFFIVAISEFDQRLREDESTSRLKEAFLLFQEICAYEAFFHTAVILFLNKSDLFEEKITRVQFSNHVAEYPGANEKDAIYKWFREYFSQLSSGKNIYSHVTNATNKENVEAVFGAVQHLFLKEMTNDMGVGL